MDIKFLQGMKHSTVHNYAVPGLSSSLIGNPSPFGTVRLFECSRDHQECITPHSHRFDFRCLVLEGEVRNIVWTQEYKGGDRGDLFRESYATYEGDMGKYTMQTGVDNRYSKKTTTYVKDDWYSMTFDQIHSIFFSKGAKVLFLEGPPLSIQSVILEPVVNGLTVPTFRTEPWMFTK